MPAQGKDLLADLTSTLTAMAACSFSNERETLSVMLFPVGIVLSFVPPRLGCVCYIAEVITWLIPDSRIEENVRAAP